MKTSLFKRSLVVVAVLVLLLIVTSPVTMIWLIKNHATDIVSDSLQGLSTSSLATLGVSEGFIETEDAVYRGSPVERRESLDEIYKATQLVDLQYQLHLATLQNPGEKQLFGEMMIRRDDYRKTRAQVVRLVGENQLEEARKLFQSEAVEKFSSYTDALAKVVAGNVTEARERGKQIIRLCYLLLAVQILLLGFFFVYGFFVPLTAFLERLNRTSVTFRE